MSKPIYLKLDTYEGIITIPFRGIEEVDNYTVMYSNMGELINKLIRLLNLQVDLYDVEAVYLTYDKYNRGLDEDSLPVKYRKDNFNYESLYEGFVTYIKKDLARILKTDIRYVKSREMLKYFDNGTLDTCEIERLVRAFFKDTGYKRKRDAYFLIRDEDDIKIEIDDVKESNETITRDLSQYSTGEDDYLSHLIQLSRNNPEKAARIMDEIAQSDLEELDTLLKISGYGIVDGVSDDKLLTKKDASCLEEATGMSIDKIKNDHTGFGRKRRSR